MALPDRLNELIDRALLNLLVLSPGLVLTEAGVADRLGAWNYLAHELGMCSGCITRSTGWN